MENKERIRVQKMLDLLDFSKEEHRISIIIEENSEPRFTFSWNLEQDEKEGKFYDFYEFFKKLGMPDIFDFKNTVVYVHGNSHFFIMLNALISKSPKKIYIKKESLNGKGEQAAEWVYIRKRAKQRSMELILI